MATKVITLPKNLAAGVYSLTLLCAAGCKDTVVITIPEKPVTESSLRGGFAEGSFEQLVQFAPFIPTQNQKDQWAWNTYQNISNGKVEFGILNSIGGIGAVLRSVTDINVLPSLSENLINTYKVGGNPDNPDTGRSFFFSVYGTPGTAYRGVTTSESGRDTGFNPNPGGDVYLNRPPVLFFQKKDNVMYVKVQGYIWFPSLGYGPPKSEPVYYHFWFSLVDNAVKFYTIIDNQRNDGEMTFRGREQEFPGCYSIANLWNQKVYTGNAPFTDQPSRRVDNSVPGQQTDTGEFLTSECWMGTTYDNSDRGIFLFTPYNSRFRGKQVISRAGGADENDTGYMNSAVVTDMDNQSTTAYEGYLYVGTESAFRSFIKGIELRPLAFDFSDGKLQGWYGINARFKRENGEMIFYAGDSHTDNNNTTQQGKIGSPQGAWKASSIQTIYLNATVTGLAKTKLIWLKSGQYDNDIVDGKLAIIAQSMDVTLSGNGTPQTYAIPVGTHPFWNDIICQLQIGNGYDWNSGGYPALNPDATIKPHWINTVNTKP